MKKVIIS